MIRRFKIAALIASAATIFAGCGGSQPPIGALRQLPQAPARAAYKSLYSFGSSSDGQQPKAPLINLSGTLYGTTYGGGVYGDGTVFSVSTTGTENVLYSFQGGNDGTNPSAGLLAVKSVLYGTTEYGGELYENGGIVFKISTTGVEKVLHRFLSFRGGGHYYYDGLHPVASLINVGGTLYGTTFEGGGSSVCGNDCGTVYSISKNGKEKVLHSFATYSDGTGPLASLLDVKGTLYGTTQAGIGQTGFGSGNGTVFSVSKSGTEKVLYDFPYGGADGYYPAAGLINVNGALYGTAPQGGAYGSFGNYGTAFSVTTSGSLTTLHSFGSGSDGGRPVAPLLNLKGTLYGTTENGGAYAKGTVFSMSLTGNETVLHSFGNGSDGAMPLAGLINVNGTLYGTTSAGGKYGEGTVFSLTP